MNLKEFTISVSKDDTPIGDLASDMLRDNEIDWNNSSDEEIIIYLKNRLKSTDIYNVFKEFKKLYRQNCF
jgi:hypothetical protein